MNKKEKIDEAARSLFLELGFENTSINAIVSKAEVAKGTFYTYYKDKDALINQTIKQEYSEALDHNLTISKRVSDQTQTPWYQAFIMQSIDYYGEHAALSKLLDHGARARIMMNGNTADTMCENIPLLPVFYNHLRLKTDCDRDVRNRFLLLSQMLGFICYQSYVLEKPDDITHIKPLLIDAAMGLCKGVITHDEVRI